MGKLKIMGKQKPPGGIPLGDFCFPKGKQKPPSGIQFDRKFMKWVN